MKIYGKTKTLLSAILSLAMLVTAFATATAFAEETAVVNEYAENAYSFLKAVGAMDAEEVPYDGAMPVTRAHFVKMALHASNDAPKVLVSNDEVFYDVDMNTKYENYIETAYRIGYISGAADGLFEPEAGITLAQATKILANILGYEKIAEANGGYPGGYLIVAQRINLLDGITLGDSDALNMENAVILLANAVNCDLMQIVSIGDNTEVKAFEDKTLLTERHDVYCAEGIITANGYTDLYAQKSELEPGYVAINGAFYKASGEIQDYLGYDVKLYYRDINNRSDKEAVWVEPTEENRVTVTNGRNLSVSGNEIELDNDNGSKSVKLADFLTFIVNGKMAVMDFEELENVTKGEITFISNDGNSSIDVIKVTDYETFIVQGISASAGLIITKDGVQIELDTDADEDYSFEIFKNGSPVALSDIAPGDIILLSEGKGTGFIHKTVLASNKVIKAEFNETGEDTAVINGKEYYIDGINVSNIRPGKEYEIRFDYFDNISYVKLGAEHVYGYLYGLAQSGMENAKCRIFTQNNRWVDLDFAKSIEFNGTRRPGEDVYAELKADENFRQLVRYNVNEDAEVILLQTAQKIEIGSKDADGDGIDEEAQAIENNTFRVASLTTTDKFCPTPKSFNGKCFVDSDAKIFVIPEDMSMEKFTILTRSTFTERTYQNLCAYDVNEYLNAAIFTMPDTVSNSKNLSSGDKAIVIKSKGQVLDSDGSIVPSLKGWWSGIEMSFAVKIADGYVTQDTYNSIGEGDVVYFKYDDNGNIISVIGVYSVRGQQPAYKDAGYYTAEIAFGKVEKCDFENSRLILTAQNGSQKGYMYNSKTGVYIWDCKEKEFRKASAAEVLADDVVVMNMTYHNANEIIVIRNSGYQS